MKPTTSNKTPTAESVMEEVWRIKDEVAAECGYDIKEMARRLREKEKGDSRFSSPSRKPLAAH